MICCKMRFKITYINDDVTISTVVSAENFHEALKEACHKYYLDWRNFDSSHRENNTMYFFANEDIIMVISQ